MRLALATIALALTSANSPNWFALLADVNPPEHRGTVYSLGNLANGVGDTPLTMVEFHAGAAANRTRLVGALDAVLPALAQENSVS